MSKKHLRLVLKIVVSAGLMYLVFRKVDWSVCFDQMTTAFQERYGWLIAALIGMGVVLGLSTWRWKTLLHGHDVAIPFFQTFRLFLVGFFFSQFMPGGLAAGDVARSYYVSCCSVEKKTECVATVILDRIIGSFGLLAVVGVALLLGGTYLGRSFLLLGGAAIMALAMVLFFSKRFLSKVPFAMWIHEHLPYRDRLTRAYEAFRHYGEHRLDLAVCFGLSILNHLVLVIVAYCAGHAVGVTATAFQYLLRIPLVNTIAALPISLGNIGTAEAGYRFFFLQGDHPEGYVSVVLAFALMMRLLRLLVALVGGIVWWAEKGAVSGRVPEPREVAPENASRESGDARAPTLGG
jgi:uncharacterized protein (TIRG00374 family)